MNRIVSYSVGLVLAMLLTLSAFSLGFMHTGALPGLLSSAVTLPAILALALAQLATQLVFFLHLGRGKDSRWNTALFCFTFFGIFVIVVASIWIMNHLNYNMTPTEMNQYIESQSGI